jgi:hypothetical protein
MSEWNIITDVVGRALSVVAMGPAGLVINPVGNGWNLAGKVFGDDDAPERTYAGGGGRFGDAAPEKAPPYPGTTPAGEPPYPGAPWPPGAPPPPDAPPVAGPDGASGEAAEAASADAADVNRLMTELHELDKRAAETADAVHASNELVKKTMEDIARDVDAKMTAMGDRVNTPEGQKELRDYLKERLQTAKEVLTNAVSYAEECARKTHEITQSYTDIGGGKGGGEPGGGPGGGGGEPGGGGGGGEPGGGEPATPPGTQSASTTPAGMPMGMPGGMMPGMGGMPSLPSLPSFGGGGMPGMSDPLSALGGLGSGAPGGQAPGIHDEAAGTEDPAAPDGPKIHDDATGPGEQPGGDAGKTDEAGTVPAAHETGSDGSDGENTEPAGNHVPGQTAGADPADTTEGTSVKLPSGVISEARNEAGATAVRAALNGDTVEEAYRKADISVPPPGTPVTDPVPPTMLKAGDIGIWKDHLVMALGNNKVLVSGQEQPLDSVGSGPDFMGWIDPTKQHASGQGQSVQPPDPGKTGA